MGLVRPRQPGQLSGLCAPDDAAHPIHGLTQQGNFLLAALAGAERIFTVMEEKPEIDEGTVELVSVRKQRRYADRVRREHGPLGLV